MAVNDNWPWTPATTAQGFLSGRWLRRDGDIYGGGAGRVGSIPNSPIDGGEDMYAAVQRSSGVPRSNAPIDPSRDLRPSVERRD